MNMKCSRRSQGARRQASIQSIILLPGTHLTSNLSSEARKKEGDQNAEAGAKSRGAKVGRERRKAEVGGESDAKAGE
jgi:hypothetical protein